MDKFRKSDLGKDELIELILNENFGENRNWQPPKLVRTVGPFTPNAFDEFYEELKNAIATMASSLNGKSKDELAILWSKKNNDTSLNHSAAGRNAYYRSKEFTKRKPSWLAGGFGHPDYVADFRYWGQMTSYSIDEVVALIVGVEPTHISTKRLDAWQASWQLDTSYPSIQYLIKQRKLIRNIFSENYAFGLSVDKEELKQRIDQIELDVDDRFYAELEKFYPNKSGRKRKLTKQVEDSSENFDIRERASMLKMIIAMAVDGYAYKIDLERSSIPKEIADALDQMGISLDLDTIRKYLKEGRDILPKDYKQE